ncbi:oxidoreductase [Microlunatus antarcticus]|uniref:Aryl-alcohol dehydrogenase-like predicted oxidoreductase n=1 Tax=Microlunatus antarcticus TaxID=53388 RepID=A0A7W5JXS2_9ACTN|nr:oxidoreductase [Microlunatus antarcticus]MBB3327662.1 aryl-alcohol dehydrogenase-like predicted oxidoreductase [Microlunatus antarcticus]
MTDATRPTAALAGTYDLAGYQVNRIGFGAMQLPGPGVMGPPKDHDDAIAVLRRAVELGVNHIDTAQFYGPDVSNALIREALHPYADDLAIVSKVGARRDTKGQWLPALTPEAVREDVEANLRALGTERLAAVNLRLQEHPVPGQAPLEDLLAAMVAMREEGLIAGVGISTADHDQVVQAIEQAAVVTVQNAYSLLDRSDEAVLRLCSDHGISYVPYFPLGSAFPGMKKVVDDATVQAVAQETDATPAQVGLAWLLAHDESVLLIPGTSSVAHLEQNLAVASVQLSDSQLARLDAIAAPSEG